MHPPNQRRSFSSFSDKTTKNNDFSQPRMPQHNRPIYPSSPPPCSISLSLQYWHSVLHIPIPSCLQRAGWWLMRISEGGAYNRRGGVYNINMSKIQAYKYSFIRKPTTAHTLPNHHNETITVLRQKLDYGNRIVPSSGVLKSSEKTAAQQEKGKVAVEGKGEGQQRVGGEGRQVCLGELVDLLGVVMRHGPALEEYLRLERIRGQEVGRDLEREYASAKERLLQHRRNRPTTQFALLKRSVINPERDHHHTHHTHHPALTIKRVFDLKLPSSLHFTLHPPSYPSLEKQRRGSTGMSTKGEVGNVGQLQLVTEKYRHSQERVRMLEQALRNETGRRDVLIADLNQQVVSGEMALLDARLRMRSADPHHS